MYEEINDFDHAVGDYTTVITMDKRNFTAYYGRGTLFLQKGDYDRGGRDLTRAIKINPASGRAYLQRSLVWEGLKKYDRQAEDFKQATRLDQKAVLDYVTEGKEQVIGSR
jgi:tetratricopeptide (TPR) repeat protein